MLFHDRKFAQSATMTKIKAGIIGMGRMGLSHHAIANMHPDVDVVAICDSSRLVTGGFEKYSDVQCFKDHKKMLKKMDLNCVFVAAPTRFHYGIVKDSLERGVHTFVEKPLSLTPSDSEELANLARRANLVNQVGYHNRFIGTFDEARRIVDSGSLGDIYHVQGEAYGPVVTKPKGSTWRSDVKEGGGCLYDYATHVINLVQFMVGKPISISSAKLHSVYSRSTDDAVYANFDIANRISGLLSVNWSDFTQRKMATQITVMGSEGKLSVNSQELRVYFKDSPFPGYSSGWNSNWVTALSPEVAFYLRGEEYSAQITYFIEKILANDLENINSFEEAAVTDSIAASILNQAETMGPANG